MNLHPKTYEAYLLLHDGVLALAKAEQQGIRIDMDYVESKKEHLTRQIARLEKNFKTTPFFIQWQRSVKGTVNINSGQQLGKFLYEIKKLKPSKQTESGQGSTDDEALRQLHIPELDDLLQAKKLKKIRDTYLDGFAREQVNGYIHPFFNLHLVKTYRGCIAEGTLILVVRDFLTNPKGIPIEEVKEGDYVYCFDDELKPAIQKVLWAGKTGYKEVIRLHYSVRGRKEFLDVTPDHKIRLINGTYIEAQKLVGDLRTNGANKHTPKRHVLSCVRKEDRLNFTGHLRDGVGIIESRLIYKQLIGELEKEDVVHHRNEIHLDHTPSNLIKLTRSRHTRKHTLNQSYETRQKCIQALKDNRYKIIYKSGIENHNNLRLSKFTCYRLLAQNAGQIVKVIHDFGVFKNHLQRVGIDPFKVKLRYDKYGNYIWKSKLKELAKLGRSKVAEKLGHNHYKLLDLYKLYDIDIKRSWANQFEEFKPGNHSITKIEWIHKKVDVYDIEVEKYHNFFANEICVHNSSDSPNFQNIPKRDKEAMSIVRHALFPRPDHQLVEFDFSGAEVKIAACYHKDPMMLKYINDPTTDMHGDLAKQIFLIKDFDSSIPSHSVLRAASKNSFIFPQFYGDYYKNCADGMAIKWGQLSRGKWKPGQGIQLVNGTLSDHLISQGIKSFEAFCEHVKAIETDFWGNRFAEYAAWKERWWAGYKKNGYVDFLTGFRASGQMGKNETINYPVQGASFHCLLWVFITLTRIMEREKWDSKLIGQIHDSIVMDINPLELDRIMEVIEDLVTVQLPRAWKWICVPMKMDIEKYEVNKSWADKIKTK